jgi:hypothetical protein
LSFFAFHLRNSPRSVVDSPSFSISRMIVANGRLE